MNDTSHMLSTLAHTCSIIPDDPESSYNSTTINTQTMQYDALQCNTIMYIYTKAARVESSYTKLNQLTHSKRDVLCPKFQSGCICL